MNTVLKTYTQPAFVICVLILAIAGGGMSIAIKSFGVHLQKEPLNLKKDFQFLSEEDISPYKVIKQIKIENKEIVETLGTEDYVQWILEDSDVPADSAVGKCMLFITYYSLPDRVPHVPEECYTGGGNQKLASESVLLDIDRAVGTEKIPARYLVFSSTKASLWQSNTKFSVLYLFSVNDVYANSRDDARLVLNKNIFGKHSYFSKVEWSFFNFVRGSKIYPTKEEAVEASSRLLSVILPVLESEYWPELEEKSTKDQ